VLKDRSAFCVAGNSLEVQKPKLMLHALKGIDVEVCSKP
jgi:hypothetical protein